MATFAMTTVKKIGVLNDTGKSTTELRITEVNGEEKFDIRGWYEKDGEERCGKGIRLSEDELRKLVELASTVLN